MSVGEAYVRAETTEFEMGGVGGVVVREWESRGGEGADRVGEGSVPSSSSEKAIGALCRGCSIWECWSWGCWSCVCGCCGTLRAKGTSLMEGPDMRRES
jgi:hypothetical protein